MTLVEILISLSIIALMAVFSVPAFMHSMRQRENLEAITQLRTALSAFELYATEKDDYPPDCQPAEIPPEMTAYYFPYFKIDWWSQETPLGGSWDWDNGYHYAYSVSISSPTRSEKQLRDFDAMIDDGDLDTGLFRQRGNQYHFILVEVEEL
jgi:type II secretory pathway pseudopilin PulG